MILKLVLFVSLFGCRVKSIVIGSKEKLDNCVTLSISDKDLELLRKISGRLDTFLDRNLESGHQTLKKVLAAFGVEDDVAVKVDPDAPLESVLLQYQIALHQDMKRMFLGMREFILGLTKGKNEVYGPGSSRSSFAKPSNLKSDSKSQIKDEMSNSSLKTSGEWGISSFLRNRKFYTPTDSTFRPADCSEILVGGRTESGIYKIYPFRCQCNRPVEVYCDMETDGGGWTVFLSRVNMSKPINFTRNWTDYKNGFGLPGEEHWLGNENLHILTQTGNYILRMEVNDGFGREIWGEWNVFKVESEQLSYKLSVTSYNTKSTAYDRFSYVNNNYFTTYDRDNDKHAKINCAQDYKGGWWYNACHNNNPTGLHGKTDALGIRINPWSRKDKTIRFAARLQLKIRPKICSNFISVAKLNTHNCAFD